MATRNLFQNVYHIDGVFFDSKRFTKERVQKAIDFQLKENDLVVGGYPKCGTTWATYVVWSIENNGSSTLPSFGDMKGKVVPFLELTGTDVVEAMSSPRKLNVHLPYTLAPKHSKAKYIYMNRNPGDCLVSYFHMMKQLHQWEDDDDVFNTFFNKFLEGEVVYGDFFDHALSWYTHKDDPNILFLLYEDMLRHPEEEILKVAKFISKPEINYEEKLLKNGGDILSKIVVNTTFTNMKNVSMKQDALKSAQRNDLSFFRKGVEKDYLNHLTPEQIQRLRIRIKEKVGGTFLEKSYDI